MVWRGFTQLALAAAVAMASASAFSVDISNMCDESMTLAHVRPSGVGTQDIAAGGSTTIDIEVGSASHVFKWGTGAQATLAELSAEGGKAWFDISIIPTGPKSGVRACRKANWVNDKH